MVKYNVSEKGLCESNTPKSTWYTELGLASRVAAGVTACEGERRLAPLPGTCVRRLVPGGPPPWPAGSQAAPSRVSRHGCLLQRGPQLRPRRLLLVARCRLLFGRIRPATANPFLLLLGCCPRRLLAGRAERRGRATSILLLREEITAVLAGILIPAARISGLVPLLCEPSGQAYVCGSRLVEKLEAQ